MENTQRGLRRLMHVTCASLLLGAMASCSDPLAPVDVAGTYALPEVSISRVSTSLPGDGYEYRLVADTVVLKEDETLVNVQWYARTHLATSAISYTVNVNAYRYRIDGLRVLAFNDPCSSICAAIAPAYPSYRLLGGHLVRESAATLEVSFVYERVSRAAP